MIGAAVFSWLGNMIAGPVLKSATDAYKSKLAAGNDAGRIAADLAAKEIELQRREVELQNEYKKSALGYWYEPDKLMGYAVAIYLAKLLVWDKVLGLGTTDPLVGWVDTTTNLIISFYFAKRGFENVARIIKR
jgi:hypothetical protein